MATLFDSSIDLSFRGNSIKRSQQMSLYTIMENLTIKISLLIKRTSVLFSGNLCKCSPGRIHEG